MYRTRGRRLSRLAELRQTRHLGGTAAPPSLRDSPSFRLPPASRPPCPLLLSPDYFPCLQLVPLPAARGGFLEGEGPWKTIQHECLGLPVVIAHKVTRSLVGKHLAPQCSALGVR